jgi:predicted transcriptional regulator
MTAWFSRVARRSDAHRGTVLGPLEWRVLTALWDRAAAASVRDLAPLFPEAAYTTLMTTLDRLYRKSVLNRTKVGRAFLYQPQFTRREFESAQVADALKAALDSAGGEVRPLLSFFVEAVSDHDRALLDELEMLVQARRAEIEGRRS